MPEPQRCLDGMLIVSLLAEDQDFSRPAWHKPRVFQVTSLFFIDRVVFVLFDGAKESTFLSKMRS